MLDEGGEAIAAAFTILASAARLPAVFHCSAGKDRTGVLAALVLSALGVPDDVIAADYHLSALAVDQLVAWLKATRPELTEEMARQPKAFLSCPPEAMHAFLDALRARHGSIEAYLMGIGVESEVLARLRQVLLEPA
jgi:protein-tyrosine phosphatase